jgi:hypothetical protein
MGNVEAVAHRIDEMTSRINETTSGSNVMLRETLARTKALARLVTELPRATVPRRVLILPETAARDLVAADEAAAEAEASLLERVKQALADDTDKVSPFVRYRVFLCCDGRGHDSALTETVCKCGEQPLHDGYPLSLPGPKLRKLAPLLQTGLKFLKYGLMAGKAVTGLPVPTQFGTTVFDGATGLQTLIDGFCDVFDNKRVASATTQADGLSDEAAKAAALDAAKSAVDATPRAVYAAAYDLMAKLLEAPGSDSKWLKDRNSTLLWQVADTLAPLAPSSGGGHAALWLCRAHAVAALKVDGGERFTLAEGTGSLGATETDSADSASVLHAEPSMPASHISPPVTRSPGKNSGNKVAPAPASESRAGGSAEDASSVARGSPKKGGGCLVS